MESFIVIQYKRLLHDYSIYILHITHSTLLTELCVIFS